MKIPHFIEEGDTQHPSAAPAVVVAIGEHGRQVLAALSQAATLRPGLANTHGVWAGSDGWLAGDGEGSPPWAEPIITAWLPGERWWQLYGENGRRVLQQTVERAQVGAESDEQTLDLYLVAHLQEMAGRDLWRRVLGAARAAAIPFSDHVITLIFATDSRAFGQLSTGEADALRAALAELAGELEAATDPSERPGRVGWCYLVDTVNANGYPLRPVAHVEAEPPVVQAHTIAEFIAHLAGGLRQTEAYRRISLANLHRDSRSAEPVARVGTFAAGSLLFPVASIAEVARDQLARRLLSNYFLGPDRPGDLPAARLLRERWLSEHALAPADLRRDISHDAGGHPIEFSLEPPELRQIYDDDPERLPDALRNWDHILRQRWTHEEGPPQQMAESAQRVLDGVTGWLDEAIDRLLSWDVGGLRRAGHFVREAEMAVLVERERDEDTVDEGWLTLLLGAVRHRPDPTFMPDPDAAQRRLEHALTRRVNRRAVWTRAAVFAVVLLSFVWTAYLAAGEAWGLHGVVAARLRLQAGELTRTLDLLALALGCWLLTLVAAWTTIYLSEGAVIRAAEQMARDIRQKFRALMESTLGDERERLYDDILSSLVAWRERVEERKQRLTMLVKELEQVLASRPQAVLLTEGLLLAPELWFAHLPELESVTMTEMAADFLTDAEWPPGPEESVDQLLAAVRAVAKRQLRSWRDELGRTQGITSADSIEPRLAELRRPLRPAWPLDREERMAVAAGDNVRATNSQKGETWRSATFISLPPTAVTPDLPRSGRRTIFYCNGEPGRLSYASTIHALPLAGLRLWHTLADAGAGYGNDSKWEDVPAAETVDIVT